MEWYVGAIDQGTTSTRFMVFDRQGRVISRAQREHAQLFPQPGWVEHDPSEIWRVTETLIAQALADSGLTRAALMAVGIANQRETTVLWDRRTGAPLHNAIVWQDTRTDAMVASLAADGGADRWRATTGLPLATYFSGPKLAWLLEHVPGARALAEAGDALFGTIDTWLLWNLTGAHATDVTNASRTQMMDLRTLDWDDAILAALDVPRACLPEILPSSGLFAEATGVLAGVPVTGVLGDQQAALFGQACLRPGEAKNTYGTGCFMLMHTGETPRASSHGLLTTVAYQLGDAPPCYALEGSIAITGALVQWLRDNLRLIDDASEVEALARTAPDNGGVYFVPAFSGLYAPHWRADARGTICGMTRASHRGHIVRAALEATAFQTRDVFRAMEADAGNPLTLLRTDGGMVVNDLLMQFQADILDVPVVRPVVAETTALGAAYAAGLAVGFYPSTGAIAANWAEGARWTPAMDAARRAHLVERWDRAVASSLGWVV